MLRPRSLPGSLQRAPRAAALVRQIVELVASADGSAVADKMLDRGQHTGRDP